MKQAKEKDFGANIRNAIAAQDYVKIIRPFGNEAGFPIRQSEAFVLLQTADNFYLDGYVLLSKQPIAGIRCTRYQRAIKRILQSEGQLENGIGTLYPVDLSSWRTVFADLKKCCSCVIIEREGLAEPLWDIGPIRRVTEETVYIQFFDSTGLLESKWTAINFADITLVRFDNRYINVYQKYLRK